MEFLKNWWLWIVLTVIVLALVVVQVVWTAGYIADAEQTTEALKKRKRNIEKAAREAERGKLPTAGDVKQAEARLEDIRKEGIIVADTWQQASAALDRMHNINLTDYAAELSTLCDQNCSMLNEAVVETLKIDTDLLDEFDICERQNHNIADFTVQYRDRKETLLSWRRYLILKRIHEIAAATKVKVKAPIPFETQDEATGEVKSDYREGDWIRMIEKLGTIEFGDVVRSTAGVSEPELGGTAGETKKPSGGGSDRGRGRSEYDPYGGDYGGEEEKEEEKVAKTYHDKYPVSITLKAHAGVVQKFMENLLAAGETGAEDSILFVPRGVVITRLDEKETQPPSDDPKTGGGLARQFVAYGDRLEYWLEPPVKAVLQYDVYHFRFPPEKTEETDSRD